MQILPVRQDIADAEGGLRPPAQSLGVKGVWGASATNKQRRVYTGALLATTKLVFNEGMILF